MTRARWYRAALFLSAAGWAWLAWAFGHPSGLSPCLFMGVTHLPCPSCGTTRAILELLHGRPGDALLVNPLGVVAAMGLLVVPLWGSADVATGGTRMYRSYARAIEILSTNRVVQATAIAILSANWIWSLAKGL